MAQLSTIVPVVIYLALSFLAALWARKQSQKTSDSHGFIEEYFIGGRSMAASCSPCPSSPAIPARAASWAAPGWPTSSA